MKKRIIGLLLCVIMVCALLPLNAFATDGNILHYDYNGGKFEGKTFVDGYADTSSGSYHYIIDTVPVLDGYIFGWNTEKDGFGDAYKYGDTYYFKKINSCYDTVYAQWKLPDWIDFADTSWYDSERDSFTLSTAEQLAGLAALVHNGNDFANKTVTLADNISLAGKEWTPIGSITTNFCGIFDGDGHAVSGLYIYAPKSDYQALFGYAMGATVKDLKVSGSVTGKQLVAGIVASAHKTVIENCVNDCKVTGKYDVGGIAGTNFYTLITNCFNIAEIDSAAVEESARIGGIVGSDMGFVSYCYNIGNVSGGNTVGGIAGETYAASVSSLQFTDPAILAKCVTNIYNCYNIGSVKSKINTSGICGVLHGSASNCYNLGILESGETKVYGVTNTLNSTTVKVTDCYYLADCKASGNAFANKVGTALSSENFRNRESFKGFDFNNTWEMGAFAPALKSFNNKGTADNPYPIANLEMLEYMRDSVNKGDESFYASFVLLRDIDLGCDNNNQWVPIGTKNKSFLANLDGKGHIITGLYINKPTEDYVGFIGELGVDFTIKNLGVYGTVIGRDYVGGITGFAYSQFDNCFNACDVTGNSYVAGIAGSGSYSKFFNCYNIGNITCSNNICAGITTDPYYTKVYYCYNLGAIDCKGADVCPVVNLSKFGNDIKSCYYLSDCNADSTVFGTGDGVSALNEADFADESKFTDWDFDNTWDLSDSSVKRPLLKNAPEKGTGLNPFKVVYTDTEGGAAIHEFYYVTNNSPTPKCKTDVENLLNWRFVKWDKSTAAKVTGDVTYTAKITIKASNTLRYHVNGTTCDIYWNSETGTIDPREKFTREGYKLIGWNTESDGTGTTYEEGDTFEFEVPHNGDIYHFYAVWKDTEKPVFVGLENEKDYCYSVKFKATDNGGIASVTVGNTALTADKDGYYTINYHNDQDLAPVDYTVTATDLDGNTAIVSITLRGFHPMSAWGDDGEYFWQACGCCGKPDDTKYKIPVNVIVGNDTVCRNEDYKFTITFPSEWSFDGGNFSTELQTNGTYLCVAKNHGEGDTLSLSFELSFNPDNSPLPYIIRIDKTVTVIDHKGGTANCKDNAVCAECGKPYGETDPKNHKETLKHIDAKPATVENEGNIEYWYCSACGKYFSDKDGNTEISHTDVVIPKKATVPTTGDSSNVLLWIALLFVSATGVLTVCFFKKKKSH